MIITVTLNPAVDHVLFVDGLNLHDANRVVRLERDAGGKGINASRVISSLGGHSLATGLLGGATGAYVRHVLADEGVSHHFVRTASETRINFSVEDGSSLPPTCFNEPGPKVTEKDAEELVAFLSQRTRPGSWLLVAGSLPPGMPPETYLRLGKLAQTRSARFALDADGEALVL